MGGSGGGGGGAANGTQVNVITYAAYIETQHRTFLSHVESYRDALKSSSPFADFSSLSIDDAFLGAGVAITSFASLFDNYVSFLQNKNITADYDALFTNTVNGQNVKDLIAAEGALLSDDLETEGYPRLVTGARDMGYALSSSFVTAKANLEAKRLSLLSKFSSQVKTSLIPVVTDRWKTGLEWNKNIVSVYAQLMQLYVSATIDVDTQDFTMRAKDSLWPFTILDYERAALGALQNATTSETMAGEGPSSIQSFMSGALGGASVGGAIGGPYGAATGAAIGGIAGIFL